MDGAGEWMEGGFLVVEGYDEHSCSGGPGGAEFIVVLGVADCEAAAVDVDVEG